MFLHFILGKSRGSQQFFLTVVHMGPEGAGTAAKLVNQLLVGVHATGASEALALAKALGLELSADDSAAAGGGYARPPLLELLSRSWGDSKVLQRCGEQISAAGGNFSDSSLETSGAPLRTLVKDLQLVKSAALDAELDLRALDVATAVYRHYEKTGYGGADMAIATRYYGMPRFMAEGRKEAGIARETSWAWADIYDGGGGVS